MDMDLHDQPLGSEGELKLELKEGKLLLHVNHNSKGMSAGLELNIDPDYFMDKLAEAIPGKIDDAILEMIKAALKM